MRPRPRLLTFFLSAICVFEISHQNILVAEPFPSPGSQQESRSSSADTQAKLSAAETPQDKKIRQAIYSRNDVQQLQVSMRAKLGQVDGDTRELTLVAHLDGKSIHLRNDGERNLNIVAFVFAVFDAKGKMLKVERRDAKVDVPNTSLQDFLSTGIDADVTFKLKPGAYVVRQVVIDSEESHMATAFHRVNVPPM